MYSHKSDLFSAGLTVRWMFLGSLSDLDVEQDVEEQREEDQRQPVFPVNRSAYDRVVSLLCKIFNCADNQNFFLTLKSLQFFTSNVFFSKLIILSFFFQEGLVNRLISFDPENRPTALRCIIHLQRILEDSTS